MRKYTKEVSFCDDCDFGRDGEYCNKCDLEFTEWPEIPEWCPLEEVVNEGD